MGRREDEDRKRKSRREDSSDRARKKDRKGSEDHESRDRDRERDRNRERRVSKKSSHREGDHDRRRDDHDEKDRRRKDGHRKDRRSHREGKDEKKEDIRKGDRRDRHRDRHRDRDHHKRSRRDPSDDSRSSDDSYKKDRKKSKRHKEKDSDKHDKKKKHKKESKHSKSGREPKAKRDEGSKDGSDHPKRLKVDKSSLVSMGDHVGSKPEVLIDVEKDYFSYHQHLWIYLYREESLAFNDLTSEQARAAFARFAERYNSGKLEAPYYEKNGFPQEVIDQSKTTRHSWSFQTSATERRGLEQLQKGIRLQTEYEKSSKDESSSNLKPPPGLAPTVAPRPQVPARTPDDDDRRHKTPEERLAERKANKRLREHVKTTVEELTGGRKVGHERQLELKQEKAARIHGAAREREEARAGGVELSDDVIYGGEGGFKSTLERQKQRSARRQEQRSTRIEELQRKDQERQDNMLKVLGLTGVKPGEKIKIQPRKDGG